MNNSFLPPVSKRSKQFATLTSAGHRERMRSKLLRMGGQAFEDYELLEMLLFWVIPRKDTKPLAKDLINTFGSLEKVLSAEPEELQKKNISQQSVVLIYLLKRTIERLILPDFHNRPYLKRWNDVIIYLNDYKLKDEISNNKILRLLFLNNQQKLICDEYIPYNGTATISPIIQKALSLFAVNLITVYYVSGVEFSSAMRKNEAKFLLTLQSSAQLFDLNVGDHIICLNSQFFSVFKDKTLNV